MYSPTFGRFITKDPIGFQAGDVNLFRFVGNNPTNATDPSGLQQYKPIGETDPTKIEPALRRVIGTSKDNFAPVQANANGYQVYEQYSRDVARLTLKRGVVEVRVYRRITNGPLFDFSQLQPAKAEPAKYPYDDGKRWVTDYTRTPFGPHTIKVNIIDATVRVYQPEPGKTLPTERGICHSVSFGVSPLGRSDGFPMLPLDCWSTVLGAGAVANHESRVLLIPPATADRLFNDQKLFQRVGLEDIQPGDIIAFYTTAATADKVFPQGGLIHSFLVTNVVGIAPAPRPVK
jgi:hypothetical protein